MGIVLALGFAGVVLILLLIVWAINGAQGRGKNRAANADLRANRADSTIESGRGTGVN